MALSQSPAAIAVFDALMHWSAASWFIPPRTRAPARSAALQPTPSATLTTATRPARLIGGAR